MLNTMLFSIPFTLCSFAKFFLPSLSYQWYLFSLHCYKRKVNTSQNQGDFPGSIVDNNSPANAGDMGSIPGLGRFHMPWSHWAWAPQLWRFALEPKRRNYWARVTQLLKPTCPGACMLQLLKPVLLEPVLHNKRRQDSKPVHCNQKQPRLVHLEKDRVQQQRPRAASFFFN